MSVCTLRPEHGQKQGLIVNAENKVGGKDKETS